MKKLLLLVFMVVTLSNIMIAQTVEKTVDEFTGDEITRTSWERIATINQQYTYFQFSNVNGSIFFNYKITMPGVVTTVSEGKKLLFILDDGSKYELVCGKTVVSSQGGGAIGLGGAAAMGLFIIYQCPDDPDFSKLKERLVTKMRVYTDESFREGEVKTKDAEKLRSAISMLN